MINPYQIGETRDISWFIPVDQWIPTPMDEIFVICKGSLRVPVTEFFGITDPDKEDLNYFVLASKRCYNGDYMRQHIPQYLNYFEKFYDPDHELIAAMSNVKFKIDLVDVYSEQAFVHDLFKYVLSPSLKNKVILMNEDNYALELDEKNYKNDKNPSLIYKDRHAKLLMWVSVMINMCIPLITHYIYQKKMTNPNKFILDIYNGIFNCFKEVNLYNKLYETTMSNINRSHNQHEVLWNKQDIREINMTTHALDCIDNIILNIVPKYSYDKNIIYFNYTSINQNTHFQVTGREYEYDFIPLSSSVRDSDNNSVLDKYESFITKESMSLFMMNKVISESSMKNIELMFGPFSHDEIEFYRKRLENENGNVKNSFQQFLIFSLMYRYFGDPIATNNVDNTDYIKLLLASMRILKANNMIILPYVISSKIDRIQNKKSIGKREQSRFEATSNYPTIQKIYGKNQKIMDLILSIIGTIMSSKFRMIDYNDKTIDGCYVDKDRIADIIAEEVGDYILLINV